VAAQGQLMLEGRRLLVEGPMAEVLGGRQGQALTGGLRPEHLKLAPATNRNLAAEVSHVEALGNEQLVTCRLLEGSHLVLVRATPEQSVTVGQAVHLEIDPGGWRLFEGEGVALPRPKPQGEKGKPLELPQFQGDLQV
jgi:multiple sugar transport system ATP-binding protein